MGFLDDTIEVKLEKMQPTQPTQVKAREIAIKALEEVKQRIREDQAEIDGALMRIEKLKAKIEFNMGLANHIREHYQITEPKKKKGIFRRR